MATKPPKRPRDLNQLGKLIVDIASGQVQDPLKSIPAKNPAAVELGRSGGRARAAKLSARRLKQIAKKAASARWPKKHRA